MIIRERPAFVMVDKETPCEPLRSEEGREVSQVRIAGKRIPGRRNRP